MDKLFDLTGKVALIVGIGGIGHKLALGLAEYGADVVTADIKPDIAEKAADEIRAMGKKSLAVTVDVTSEQSVVDMVKRTPEVFPRIDILMNAFGLAIRKPAVDFPVEEWQRVMDINTRGTFICCKIVGREMVKQHSGKIINMSSVRDDYGLPSGYAAYCPSKGAVKTLTKTLACEWAKDNVLVNAMAPTFVETPLTADALADPVFAKTVKDRIPLGRWALPEDIVGPLIFFASKASDFVTGQILYVDGGVTTW